MNKERVSKHNKTRKDKKEDRMKIFANFLVDRIVEEQNKELTEEVVK